MEAGWRFCPAQQSKLQYGSLRQARMTGFFAAWQRDRIAAATDENAAVAKRSAWPGLVKGSQLTCSSAA